jgi:hypothetical protein
MLTKTLIAGTAGLALAIPMTPALAKDGDNRVEVFSGGQCSSSARWELKVKERDGGVEVEFEVDSNVVGQDWDYTTTGPSGSFSVEVDTAGAATDSFKGVATHDGQICDSTVNVGVGDDSGSDDGPGDDKGGNRSRQTFEGSCTDGAEITLKVKRSAVFRIAELEVDSDVKGQKWSYEIRRGDKTIASGNARTKGRSGSFSVKTKARGKGQLTASASRAGGSEDCSID